MTQVQESLSSPLSEEELDELSEILENFPNKMAMPLEAVDGFFTALICCPHIIPPSKYMHVIYGNEKGDDAPFDDVKQYERFFTPLMRHWNSVAARVQSAIFEPLLEDVGDYWEDSAKAWAGGFLMGMSLSDRAFDKTMASKKEHALFMPIFALAHDESFSDENVIEEEITPEFREKLINMLSKSIPVICSLLKDPKFAAKINKINKSDLCSRSSTTKRTKCKPNRTLH